MYFFHGPYPDPGAEAIHGGGKGRKPHTVRGSHLSETWRAIVTVESFTLARGEFLPPPPPPPAAPERKLLVIGDSVTCGEGVYRPAGYQCDTSPRQPDPNHSYGMLLDKAKADELLPAIAPLLIR